MEIVNAKNNGVARSKGMAKHKDTRERRTAGNKQPSFEDLFKEKHAFVDSNHTSGDLFDEFDDPFEDERDHATTATPVDRPEKERRHIQSPNGVEEDVNFDPFAEIGETNSSFYVKREDMDPLSSVSDALSMLQGGTENVNKTLSRRSCMNRFASVSCLTTSDQGTNETINTKSTSIAKHTTKKNVGSEMASLEGGKRSSWGRRASTSNLSLSTHSSRSAMSDTTGTGGLKNSRRGGKRTNTNKGGGNSCFELTTVSSHGERRESWARRASMSNLNVSLHSDSTCNQMPGSLRRGTRNVDGQTDAQNPFGCPTSPTHKNLGGTKRQSPNQLSTTAAGYSSPQHSRRPSMGNTLMMPTPKKTPIRMVRLGSVATGLGMDPTTPTPKLRRRASVATGLSNDPSTPMGNSRVRVRQQRRSSTSTPSQGKIDEETVRRLVKEHLARERARKEQEQREKEEQLRNEQEEQESEESDSDDDSANSFEDDDESVTSCSSHGSVSSTSSRWEDDMPHGDHVPKLLSRHESTDGDDLLLLASSAVETAEQSFKDTVKSEVQETEEERKDRKKVKKTSKKSKKDKKKSKKEKKEKKKRKGKSKKKNSTDGGDEHSVILEMEEATKSSAVDNADKSDMEETEPTIGGKVKKKKDKKAKKDKKSKKSNKGKSAESPAPQKEEADDQSSRGGTVTSDDLSGPVDDDQSAS